MAGVKVSAPETVALSVSPLVGVTVTFDAGAAPFSTMVYVAEPLGSTVIPVSLTSTAPSSSVIVSVALEPFGSRWAETMEVLQAFEARRQGKQ